MRVVYVGRMEREQKRILETAEVLIGIARANPDVEVTFIGGGTEEARVRAMATDVAGGRVRVLGDLPPSAVLAELLRSHVIVLLSDYEGTPTAVMEAMACGVVPVCLRIRSGIPEIIEDGVSGILVSDRSGAVVAAVRRLWDDRSLWASMSAAARQRAGDSFSLDRCAERWESVLASTIERSGASQPIRPRLRYRLAPQHRAFGPEDLREASKPSPAVSTLRFVRRSLFHLQRSCRSLFHGRQ